MEKAVRYKLKSGNVLEVVQDTCAESPNKMYDVDDLFLVYDHRNFNVKRKGFEPRDIFSYLIVGANPKYDNYYIFPVDAYIHSGVHLSLANTRDYSDRRWDVSTTGYVLVEKHIQVDHVDISYTEEEARQMAKDLIIQWNHYLSGDVYGFRLLRPFNKYTIRESELDRIFDEYPIDLITTVSSIRKKIDESAECEEDYEVIYSSWGFYGDNPETNGMLENTGECLLKDNES